MDAVFFPCCNKLDLYRYLIAAGSEEDEDRYACSSMKMGSSMEKARSVCRREHHGMRSRSKHYSSDVMCVPCMSCIGLANRFLALRWFRFRWWAGTHDGAVRISDENELMFTFAY